MRGGVRASDGRPVARRARNDPLTRRRERTQAIFVAAAVLVAASLTGVFLSDNSDNAYASRRATARCPTYGCDQARMGRPFSSPAGESIQDRTPAKRTISCSSPLPTITSMLTRRTSRCRSTIWVRCRAFPIWASGREAYSLELRAGFLLSAGHRQVTRPLGPHTLMADARRERPWAPRKARTPLR